MLLVDSFLSSLRTDVQGVQEFQNLRIFPLVSDLATDTTFKTYDEVKDFVEAKEFMDGEVPFLHFTNNTDYSVLVLSGSLITGNFQDRTVATPFILHPREERKVSVFCVEQSRFHSKGQRGQKSPFHLSADIRMGMKKNGQHYMWQKIREKKERMRVISNNSSVEDIYVQRRRQLGALQQSFSCGPHHIGMVAEIEGNVIGMDCFGARGIFHKVQPSLLSSYAIDALDEDYCATLSQGEKMTVDEFIESVMRTTKTPHSQNTTEAIVDFESEEVMGSALLDNGMLLQLEAFKA